MVDVNQNFSLIRGQTKIINVTIRDEETGAPYVLTTENTVWQLLDSPTSTTPIFEFYRTQGIIWTNRTNGQIQIEIQGSQSDTLDIKHYHHILWIKLGAIETPVLEGRLEVRQSGPGV